MFINSQFFTQIQISDIKFPYAQPYPLQKRMMRTLLYAIQNKKQCLIQSPTGTGKTLCMLSACLEAVQQKKVRRIYYLTRTHSQMDCIVKQLHASKYQPVFSLMQSKKGLCANKHVQQTGKKYNNDQFELLCRLATKVSSQQSQYIPCCKAKTNFKNLPEQKVNILKYLQYDYAKRNTSSAIKQLSFNKQICPYLIQSTLSKHSELVILSYKYICDKFIFYRKKLKTELYDSIILFDEAHNIIQTIKEEQSFLFNRKLIQKCQTQIDHIRNLLQQEIQKSSGDTEQQNKLANYGILLDQIQQYVLIIRKFYRTLKQLYQYKIKGNLLILDIEQISLHLKKLELQKFDDFYSVNEPTLAQLELYTQKKKQDENQLQQLDPLIQIVNKSKNKNIISNFFKFCYFFSQMINIQNFHQYYKCCLVRNEDKQIEIRFQCLTSKFAFQRIKKCGISTIIFASGTLKPFQQYRDTGLNILKQLQFEPSYPKQNILQDDNVRTFFITDYQNVDLELTFHKIEYETIIEIISRIVQKVPFGTLIFFKSFAYMFGIKKKMQQKNIKFAKPTYWEYKQKALFDQNVKGYVEQAQKKSGAIFMTVFRGKISQGYNFKDNLCRGAILIGIPFLDINSLKYKLNERVFKQKSQFNQWYMANAMLAINQACGRLIRSKDDFGCLYLIGNKYYESRFRKQLSKWILRNLYYQGQRLNNIIKITGEYFSKKQAQGKLKQVNRITNNQDQLQQISDEQNQNEQVEEFQENIQENSRKWINQNSISWTQIIKQRQNQNSRMLQDRLKTQLTCEQQEELSFLLGQRKRIKYQESIKLQNIKIKNITKQENSLNIQIFSMLQQQQLYQSDEENQFLQRQFQQQKRRNSK